MQRPRLVYCISLNSDNQIAILASVNIVNMQSEQGQLVEQQSLIPLDHLDLLKANKFTIKLVGLSKEGQVLTIKHFETDELGILSVKITSQIEGKTIEKFILYESSFYPGIEIHLGSLIPFKIEGRLKVVISDFDKTLIETHFSTFKEVIRSLKMPMSHFPRIEESMKFFKNYINEGHVPFVLSASPHFYEAPIRNWLYQHDIYNASIFLKDYRNILSFNSGALTTKDIKKQGFYKLGQLIYILLMVGIPDELVLMGDGIEADQDIYQLLNALLQKRAEPWALWNQVKMMNIFNFTTKQNVELLNKLYLLSERVHQSHEPKVTIYIRCTKDIIDRCKNAKPILPVTQKIKDNIIYYIA